MRGNYRLWSYLDDLAIAVPASMINHTMHYATAALEKSGYQINWGKLEIYAKVTPPVGYRTHFVTRPWRPIEKSLTGPRKRTTDGVVLWGSDQLEPGTTGFQPRPPVWIGTHSFHDRTCQAVLNTISELTDHLDSLLAHAPDRTPALSAALLLLRPCVLQGCLRPSKRLLS